MIINAMAGMRVEITDHQSSISGKVVSLTVFDGVSTRTVFFNEAQLKILSMELEKRLNG